MKLNIKKSADISETEITIEYSEMNADIERIIEQIKGCDYYIKGKKMN